MVKICARCCTVWAGGYRCLDCGAVLSHTSDPIAREMPELVWRNQRIDYGARRGMILRFIGIFAGVLTAIYGVRASVVEPAPWSWICAGGSLAGGTLLWWIIHTAAGRGVRIWVLRKGQLQKRKLAKALAVQATPGAARRD